METIAEGIYHLDDVVGGPTLLVVADRITLIDTGLPGSEEAIFGALESLGRSPADIKLVLITHADGDHIGHDLARDKIRFTVSEGGVTVVQKAKDTLLTRSRNF